MMLRAPVVLLAGSVFVFASLSACSSDDDKGSSTSSSGGSTSSTSSSGGSSSGGSSSGTTSSSGGTTAKKKGEVCTAEDTCEAAHVCTVYEEGQAGVCFKQCADSLSDCEFEEKCCTLNNVPTAVCVPENIAGDATSCQ